MSPTPLVLGLAIATAASASSVATPQDPQPRPPIVIGAEVEIVSVPVMVYDKAGRFVADLKKNEIQILEDGVPQEITYLASSASPMPTTSAPGTVTSVMSTVFFVACQKSASPISSA